MQHTHCNAGEGVGRLIGKLKPSQDESELLKYSRSAGFSCYRAPHTLLEAGEEIYKKVGCSCIQLVQYVRAVVQLLKKQRQHCAKFTAVGEEEERRGANSFLQEGPQSAWTCHLKKRQFCGRLFR